MTGAIERMPGPLSREGYRIVQEALTNALRHAGPVPVVLRVAARDAELELDIRNPLPTADAARAGGAGGGSGLRGIRERAALLGREAHTGPADGRWRVPRTAAAEPVPVRDERGRSSPRTRVFACR